MTQYGGDRNNPYQQQEQQQEQYQQPHQPQYAQPTRTSGLAVASFVCSMIFCCPLTTIPGVILGIISTATIGKNPALRGKGFAIAAIIIGLLGSALQGGAGWWLGSLAVRVMDVVDVDANTALRAGANGDYPGFRAAFGNAASGATDAEIQVFMDDLNSRFGLFQSLTLDESDPNMQQSGAEQFMIPVVLNFENQQTTGMVHVRFIPMNTFELYSIEIRDGTETIVFP